MCILFCIGLRDQALILIDALQISNFKTNHIDKALLFWMHSCSHDTENIHTSWKKQQQQSECFAEEKKYSTEASVCNHDGNFSREMQRQFENEEQTWPNHRWQQHIIVHKNDMIEWKADI